jgi:hypothetical protein
LVATDQAVVADMAGWDELVMVPGNGTWFGGYDPVWNDFVLFPAAPPITDVYLIGPQGNFSKGLLVIDSNEIRLIGACCTISSAARPPGPLTFIGLTGIPQPPYVVITLDFGTVPAVTRVLLPGSGVVTLFGQQVLLLVGLGIYPGATYPGVFPALAAPAIYLNDPGNSLRSSSMGDVRSASASADTLFGPFGIVAPGLGIVAVDPHPDQARDFVTLTGNPAMRAHAEIRFGLSHADQVEVEIFDVAGHRVRALVAREFSAGEHSVRWDGLDERGAQIRAGVYFACVRYLGSGFRSAKKLTLLH